MLFYDYTTLIVDFSNKVPRLEKSIHIYADKQTTKSLKTNIYEISKQLNLENEFE